jgi:hypothetical protein
MDRLTMEWATRRLADFKERNAVGGEDGWTVLSQAIFCGRVTFMKLIMEPSFVSHGNGRAMFFINILEDDENSVKRWGYRYKAELALLLDFMELLGDPPLLFLTQHAVLAARGQLLREQLPSYLEQQRAAVVAHCPLPTVLQSIVAAYAAPTPLDMWTDGLRIQAPRDKSACVAADVDQADEGLPSSASALSSLEGEASVNDGAAL